MANKKTKMSEGGRSKPDPLARRYGANFANRMPREGQTNFRNIPVGNHPDAPNYQSAEAKALMDRDRKRAPTLIKKMIKEDIGTHTKPNLPKAKGGKVKKMCGGGW